MKKASTKKINVQPAKKNQKELNELKQNTCESILRKGNQPTIFPRWATVVTVVVLATFSLGVIAGFVIPKIVPSKVGYKGSCSSFGTSCNTTLGLECVNGICGCGSDKFFEKGSCQLRKSFMNPCNGNSSYCNLNINLVCKDGKCKCGPFNFWNGKSCVPKQFFNGPCQQTDDECMTDASLYCDVITKRCICSKYK